MPLTGFECFPSCSGEGALFFHINVFFSFLSQLYQLLQKLQPNSCAGKNPNEGAVIAAKKFSLWCSFNSIWEIDLN